MAKFGLRFDVSVFFLIWSQFFFIVSSAQFALGLPTLLLGDAHFLRLLPQNDIVCVVLPGLLIRLIVCSSFASGMLL